MSELTDKLMAAAEARRGTDLGGLLQWAALHIASQDEALTELREEHANEERERLRLERGMLQIRTELEAVLSTVADQTFEPVALSRDFAPHINVMGAVHSDPDYQTRGGKQTCRHIDTRDEPKKRKAA